MNDRGRMPERGSSSRLRVEAGNVPQEAPPTCGQNVHKLNDGGKLRQDTEKSRPSDRLRHEDAAPPGGGERAAPDGEPAANGGEAAPGEDPGHKSKKAAREGKRFEKSKLRMDKADEKLNEARDKLAAQKPPKRSRRIPSGPVKAVGRMARAELWAYTHGKIYQVEHENVGIEAAHKTELAGEGGARGASGFIRRRIRTRPARRVRKWEKKNINARTDHAYRTLSHEHPELNENALSRFLQKQRIKKQYQKQARAAAKTAAFTERISRAVFGFIRRNPKIVLLALCAFLFVVILQSCMAVFTAIGNGLAGALGGASYLAKDIDINQAELAYAEWEADLTLEARNAPYSHPGYDEYRYFIDSTGHDPHALLAFLTAKYDNFTFSDVEPVLRDIFAQQYSLTFTRIVEVRYRREYYTDEDVETHSRIVPYNYYILEVRLTARPFMDIIGPMLDTRDAEDRYDLYTTSKGNRQYVGSPFPFNWLPYVSCQFGYRVHPISGGRDFHRGIDIALPTGMQIHAGGKGVVVEAGSHPLYGLTVKIDYGGGVTARYSHCSALLVSIGQKVKAGDVIALVGSTGNSTGPHLDLEVLKDGELLNPLYFVEIP